VSRCPVPNFTYYSRRRFWHVLKTTIYYSPREIMPYNIGRDWFQTNDSSPPPIKPAAGNPHFRKQTSPCFLPDQSWCRLCFDPAVTKRALIFLIPQTNIDRLLPLGTLSCEDAKLLVICIFCLHIASLWFCYEETSSAYISHSCTLCTVTRTIELM
jgi:hypothetical protein